MKFWSGCYICLIRIHLALFESNMLSLCVCVLEQLRLRSTTPEVHSSWILSEVFAFLFTCIRWLSKMYVLSVACGFIVKFKELLHWSGGSNCLLQRKTESCLLLNLITKRNVCCWFIRINYLNGLILLSFLCKLPLGLVERGSSQRTKQRTCYSQKGAWSFWCWEVPKHT